MGEETFEIPPAAAETYEAVFVPALFAEWAPLVADAAGVGADRNEAMLTVARRVAPGIEFRQADVADLPFARRMPSAARWR